MASKRKVCVLGLGSMGLGVALALLERQFDVSGFDINKQACKSFAEAGGKVGLNPEDAAKGASVVIILVVNEAQVDEVLFGSEGAIGGFGLATVVIQSSTVSPAFAGLCGTRLQQAGFDMIDAPVSGGAAGARAGNLSIMASGAAKAQATPHAHVCRVMVRAWCRRLRGGASRRIRLHSCRVRYVLAIRPLGWVRCDCIILLWGDDEKCVCIFIFFERHNSTDWGVRGPDNPRPHHRPDHWSTHTLAPQL